MKKNLSNPGEDLHTIREIMERSSKFLSLSGLAGVFAGMCALAGAGVAMFILRNAGLTGYSDFIHSASEPSVSAAALFIAVDALLVLGCAFAGAIYFSWRKANKAGQSLWTNSTRRLIVHLLIPLVAGGIFIIILISQNNTGMVASSMLIFYGLSLVNAGKFTFGEIHYLGLTAIALGLLAGIFPDYGLLMWTAGFGFMHIVYGLVMYYRHGH